MVRKKKEWQCNIDDSWKAPPRIILKDKYLLISKIGEGTFSEIFGSVDILNGKIYSIKQKRDTIDGTPFKMEAKILKLLKVISETPQLIEFIDDYHISSSNIEIELKEEEGKKNDTNNKIIVKDHFMVMDLLRGEDMGNLRDRTRAKAFDAIKQRNKEEKEAKQDASNVNNSLSQSSLPIIATTTPDASISTPRNSDKKISLSELEELKNIINILK